MHYHWNHIDPVRGCLQASLTEDLEGHRTLDLAGVPVPMDSSEGEGLVREWFDLMREWSDASPVQPGKGE